MKKYLFSLSVALMVLSTLLLPLQAPAFADGEDLSPPVFTGSESSDGSDVYLTFDEAFTINAPDGSDEEQIESFLKSQISVSGDGGAQYMPFSNQESDAEQAYSNQLYLAFDNDMKIITGSNAVIKIAGGTLKDEAGNLNADMELRVSPPGIQSAEISSDNHDVTITFNEDVFDNTDGYLKNAIYLYKDSDSNGKSMTDSDTASVEAGKLHIHFAEALSGSTNQIEIDGSAVKDTDGNIQTDDRKTGLIAANIGSEDPNPMDTTAPIFEGYSVTNSFQDLNLFFDEDVQNATADIASFLQNVQWYNSNTSVYGLPSDTTVTFSGHTAIIHFAVPLTGYQYIFQFYGGHFEDAAGNISDDYVSTDWIYPQTQFIPYSDGHFSYDGRLMTLDFDANNELVDSTIVDGVSHLKEQITLSTDGGLTYAPLNELDSVSLHQDQLKILFHEAIKAGSIKVKVAAGAVYTKFNSLSNAAVDAVVAYNTPDITGFVLSNAASEFVYADNAAWRDKVRAVNVYDEDYDVYTQLNSSDYTLNEGKLTISKGIFQEGHYYEISVDAQGYSTKYFEGLAFASSEIFYMTAPELTMTNGITAKVNILNNAFNYGDIGNQSVVFELFNGSTPVSIIAAHFKLGTGTYSANFNVSDAAANPNYTVKAYVVSKYNDDPADLGLNMATVKTQSEWDQAAKQLEDNDNHNNP